MAFNPHTGAVCLPEPGDKLEKRLTACVITGWGITGKFHCRFAAHHLSPCFFAAEVDGSICLSLDLFFFVYRAENATKVYVIIVSIYVSVASGEDFGTESHGVLILSFYLLKNREYIHIRCFLHFQYIFMQNK